MSMTPWSQSVTLSMRSVKAYHGLYQVLVSVFRSVSLWLCRQQACLYAGYLCKVIKSIRVWLRPVRCGTDDKSASVNRLKLEGGAPDSGPIRLYIHLVSFPITLQLLFAGVLTLVRRKRDMTEILAPMLVHKQTFVFCSVKHERCKTLLKC